MATLLKLYSHTATASRLDSTEAMAALHKEIAFAYVSCALSVMPFGISAMGVREVYSGLQQALRRSSAALRGRMARVAIAAVNDKVLSLARDGCADQPVAPCCCISGCLYGVVVLGCM